MIPEKVVVYEYTRGKRLSYKDRGHRVFKIKYLFAIDHELYHEQMITNFLNDRNMGYLK